MKILILVFGAWLNPLQVTHLIDSGDECIVSVTAHNHYHVRISAPCDDVAAKLNEWYHKHIRRSSR